MATITIIESMVKRGEVLSASLVCDDEGITSLELLNLLKKYMDITQELQSNSIPKVS